MLIEYEKGKLNIILKKKNETSMLIEYEKGNLNIIIE